MIGPKYLNELKSKQKGTEMSGVREVKLKQTVGQNINHAIFFNKKGEKEKLNRTINDCYTHAKLDFEFKKLKAILKKKIVPLLIH